MDGSVINLRKTFWATHPDWEFRGINLYEELGKLEARIAFGNASIAELTFVRNAVEQAGECVNETYEKNELAFLLLKYLQKFGGNTNS